MAGELQGKRVAFLMANEGVEQIECFEPRKAVEEAGAEVEVISTESGQVQGFEHLDKAETCEVDRTTVRGEAPDYDGVVLPGGVANPDNLRIDEDACGSCANSSRRASRSARSAMRRGCWSRPTWSRSQGHLVSEPGDRHPQCGWQLGRQGGRGRFRPGHLAASRTTSRRSTRRSSRSSQRVCTRSSARRRSQLVACPRCVSGR